MNISFSSKIIERNDLKFPFYNVNGKDVFIMNQKHTIDIIEFVDYKKHKERGFDGVVTLEKGNYGIFTADCIPIVIKFGSGFCIIHAGWKGVVGRIIQKAFILIEKKYKIKKENCSVYVGPHIRKESYEIVPLSSGGDGREQEFIKTFGNLSIIQKREKYFLDLTYCVLKEVKGVSNLELDDRDTFRDNNLPSYFRNKTFQRLLTIVTLS